MKRRFNFKLYQNRAQQEALERMRQLHSALYNALLEQRIDAYHRGDTYARCCKKQPGKDGGVTLSAFDQGREITKLRAEDAEYRALSRGSLEQTVKRVDLAFQSFFRRARQGAGAQSGFPRFKRCDGFGMREMAHGGWHFTGTRLKLQGVPGLIRARGKFPAVPEKILSCDLKLNAGTWWLSVVVEMPPRMRRDGDRKSEITFNLIDEFARVRRVDGGHAPGPAETVYAAAKGRITTVNQGGYDTAAVDTPQSQGDRGLVDLPCAPCVAVDTPQSQGDRGQTLFFVRREVAVDTPQSQGDRGEHAFIRCAVDTPQSQGDRLGCRRGSCRYKALRRLKQRLEAHAARRRREALHVWTTTIARDHSHLVLIAPPIAETTKSGRGSARSPGAAVAIKADVNRHILGQAPAMAIAMLTYKLTERGGSVEQPVDEAAPATIGNDLVAATKETRKLKRSVQYASRLRGRNQDGEAGAGRGNRHADQQGIDAG